MSASAPPAATITVRETLDLLDGPFAAVAAGVSEDRYAFWLGSGISFGRVDGLKQIVSRVVDFLRTRAVPNDETCRFRRALKDVLAIAGLAAEDFDRLDLTRPLAEWAAAGEVVARLTQNYARMLDVKVDGEADDYLLWEAVDVRSTFADSAKEPDVEHVCLAALVLEGVASEIASANWDALIERALERLSNNLTAIAVLVRPDDMRGPPLRAHLYKFHGCAMRAVADEETYRPLLIGRQSQIHRWVWSPENAAMVNRLLGVIVAKPTLMIGLSAQDANVQAIFARAETTMPWDWPGDRPSYVFSENQVGVDQQCLLQNVYRTAYSPATRQQISSGSLIQAYAKPLLAALVLHVLYSKLRRLVELAPARMLVADRQMLMDGLTVLRNAVSAGVETDPLPYMLRLFELTSRAIGIFRDGRVGNPPRPYQPISTGPIQLIASDPGLPSSGLTEAAVAIGILGAGVAQRAWTLGAAEANEPNEGVLHVQSEVGSAKLFVVANSHAALRLRNNGDLVDGDESIVVQSLEIAPMLSRSPRGAPGRTGRIGLREVSITTLLEEAANTDELLQRFREEVAI